MNTIDHPKHYAEATHGIPGECITYTEHLGFVRGNAFKYVWRCGFKGDALEDIRKALWYINHDITHGQDTPTGKPGHLTHQLATGPDTLRTRVLLDLWNRRNLVNTHALLVTTLNDPTTLDERF